MKIKNIQKEKLECTTFHGWQVFAKDSIPVSEGQKLAKSKKKSLRSKWNLNTISAILCCFIHLWLPLLTPFSDACQTIFLDSILENNFCELFRCLVYLN